MGDQMTMYEIPNAPPATTPEDKLRRNWENGFQRWSNEAAKEETNPLGICGYGSMCDHCADNTYGRPCVRALNEMCREKRIIIDYSKRNYEEIWNGVFKSVK